MVNRDRKVHNLARSLFFLNSNQVWSPGRDKVIRCVSKSHRNCLRHSLGQMLDCAYTVYSYGQNEISSTSPSGSYCPSQSLSSLITFLCNLLLILIMWWVVSSLSPRNLQLLFCCVLSIHALIWLVLIAFICAAYKELFCFSLKFSLSNPRPASLEWDVAH